MKKATIAKLLVVCLIVSMLCIPAGAVAVDEINWSKDNTYTLTEDTALTGTVKGNAYKITLNADKRLTSGTFTVDSGASLDVYQTVSSAKTLLFSVKGSADVTVKGNGVYKFSDDAYKLDVSVTLKSATATFSSWSKASSVNVTAGTGFVLDKEGVLTNGLYVWTAKTSGNNNNNNGIGGGTTTPSEPKDTEVTTKPGDMSNSDANKMVNEAVKNNSENVTLKVDAADTDTEVSVTIPASAVKDLANKTEASLTVETPVAKITLPNEALKELANGSSKVGFNTAEVDENTVKIAVTKDGVEQTSISGGLKATVDLPQELQKTGTVAFIVNADGTKTLIKKSVAKDGGLIVPLDGTAIVQYVDNSKTFDDEIPAWSKEAVDFVTSRELFQGTADGTFDAGVTMNRAMLVTVLHRLENTPAGGTPEFGDVDSGTWYTDAVAWASSNEIVKGYENGDFRPDNPVSRQEIAVFLYRYATMMKLDTTPNKALTGFDDGANTADWAKEAMEWAVGAGLIKGDDNGALNPQGEATRAEVATMLMRLVEYMA